MDGARREACEAHVRDCAACRALLADVEWVERALLAGTGGRPARGRPPARPRSHRDGAAVPRTAGARAARGPAVRGRARRLLPGRPPGRARRRPRALRRGLGRDAVARARPHPRVATEVLMSTKKKLITRMALWTGAVLAGRARGGRGGPRSPARRPRAVGGRAEARAGAGRRALAQVPGRAGQEGRQAPGRPDAGRGDRGALLRGADGGFRARLGHGNGRRVPLRRAEGIVQPAERGLRPRDHAAAQGGRLLRPPGVSPRAPRRGRRPGAARGAHRRREGVGRGVGPSPPARGPIRPGLRALGAAQDGGRRRSRQPVPEAGGGRARVVSERPAQGSRGERGRRPCGAVLRVPLDPAPHLGVRGRDRARRPAGAPLRVPDGHLLAHRPRRVPHLEARGREGARLPRLRAGGERRCVLPSLRA